MDPHDLVLSKLGAGRDKDLDFATSAAKLGLLQRNELMKRLHGVACSAEHRALIATRVDALFA